MKATFLYYKVCNRLEDAITGHVVESDVYVTVDEKDAIFKMTKNNRNDLRCVGIINGKICECVCTACKFDRVCIRPQDAI